MISILVKLSDRLTDLRGASVESNLKPPATLFKALKNTIFGPWNQKIFGFCAVLPSGTVGDMLTP
jgi:hypothetical protein